MKPKKERLRLFWWYEVNAYLFTIEGEYLTHLYRTGFDNLNEVMEALISQCNQYQIKTPTKVKMTVSCGLLRMRKEYIRTTNPAV